MSEGFIPEGPGNTGGGMSAPGPMRRPDAVGDPASQWERLDEVVARVFSWPTVSRADHANVTALCKSCGEND